MLVWSLLRTGATEIKTKLFSHPTLRGRKTSHPDRYTQSTCQHSRSAQCLPPLTPLPPAVRAPCCQPASLAMTSSPLRAPPLHFLDLQHSLSHTGLPSLHLRGLLLPPQTYSSSMVSRYGKLQPPEGSLPKTWRELPHFPQMQSLVSQSAP